MDETVIEISNLDFAYNIGKVLENVNLTVKSGDFASIVGPNGSGKTTLFKIILGLVAAQQGRIEVFGKKPVAGQPGIGYMPQFSHFDPQFPVTVIDVVLLGRLGVGAGWRYRVVDREASLAALEEVELVELADSNFSTLSGGQRQRVLIARALCSNPRLLLLDEPTANVDALVEEKLFKLLQVLNQRMTILIVSHDLGFVSSLVKSVICVNRTVAVHPTSEITGEVIKEIYGTDLRLVRHDHRCSEEGHIHG